MIRAIERHEPFLIMDLASFRFLLPAHDGTINDEVALMPLLLMERHDVSLQLKLARNGFWELACAKDFMIDFVPHPL